MHRMVENWNVYFRNLFAKLYIAPKFPGNAKKYKYISGVHSVMSSDIAPQK